MFSFLLRIQDRDKRGTGIGLHLGGGTPHRTNVYWEGGTPHILSRYFNKGGDTAQIQSGVYSARKSIWSVGGWFFQEVIPLRGSILQAGTCQILSLAENPRWSRVWQQHLGLQCQTPLSDLQFFGGGCSFSCSAVVLVTGVKQ